MSHHLDSPIVGKISTSTSRTSIYSAAKQAPSLSSMFATQFFGAIPVPGYHPEGMYEFNVDLNGDAIEDLTYRLTARLVIHSGSSPMCCTRSATHFRTVRPSTLLDGIQVTQRICLPATRCIPLCFEVPDSRGRRPVSNRRMGGGFSDS